MSDDFTPDQQVAIEALVSGCSQAEAAEKAGVNRSTVHRWLKLEGFANAVLAAQFEQIGEANRRIRGQVTHALDQLSWVVSGDYDAKEAGKARVVLQAALAILDRAGLKSGELKRPEVTKAPTDEQIEQRMASVVMLRVAGAESEG